MKEKYLEPMVDEVFAYIVALYDTIASNKDNSIYQKREIWFDAHNIGTFSLCKYSCLVLYLI